MSVATAYNYAVFPPAMDPTHFAAFAEHLKAGSSAPDGPLTLLDGGEVRLGELWRDASLVLEFGSIT